MVSEPTGSDTTLVRSLFVNFKDPSLEQVTEFICPMEHVPVEMGEVFNYKLNWLG